LSITSETLRWGEAKSSRCSLVEGIYEDLLNHMGDDEVVLFADAVHPTHAVRPVGCWAT
jgi:hypothetical protein